MSKSFPFKKNRHPFKQKTTFANFMALPTVNHDVISNQLRECLRTCEDTWKSAKEAGLNDIAKKTQKTYSDIIIVQQDFGIYADRIRNFTDGETFDNVLQDIEQYKENNSNRLMNERKNLLNEQIQRINQSVEDGSDEEITIEGEDSAAGLICPLTQKLPDFPVVSRTCHHVFEKDAILEYIQRSTNRRQTSVECPFAGCNQMISRNSLYEDPAITRRVKQAKQHGGNDYEKV